MNFIDSDRLDYSGMPDGDTWSNHPGFLGGTWWKDFWQPKKAEEERYQAKLKSVKEQYKLTDDCDEIDATINDIDKALTKNANSGAKDRVIKRTNRALENRRLDFKDKWDDNDCTQKRIDAADLEYQREIQAMFDQANQRSFQRKTEDKTLTNVALGVGALVIGVVAYMAIRK